MLRASGGDADAYARHVVEHMAESGSGGSPHFALARSWQRDEVKAHLLARLSRELWEPLWGRAWVLVAPDGEEVVGHLELRGGRVPAEMHRATLGMGIARRFTGQGHGRRLVETAVKWAKKAELAWIDLGVFSENEPARKLYRRMGFVEIGTRRDAFRLDAGVEVDDVLMTLEL
jgi:RimJ/RimL family protein N-acetyltransferase